ncbi:hypothetical protein P2T68_16825 [Pseudomonas sp. G11]|uniref:hypothetical protein n=1 Tax=Pseudomonas sp. G11 TaxID=528343 RepID=UPI002402BB35|nr:hypothetical protein [Pseudomonas sp. G11]WEX18908.1 hypothetical protein P2T68_16825 [Pseudomonas sp. G11]
MNNIPKGYKRISSELLDVFSNSSNYTLHELNDAIQKARALAAAPTPPQPIYDEAVAMVEYLLPVIDPMAFVAIRKAEEFISRAKAGEDE